VQRIIINVKDDKKINILLNFLNEIKFIDVEKEKKEKKIVSRKGDFRKLFGIWRSREISLADIRKKAWQ
jgi:hypothetical protein